MVISEQFRIPLKPAQWLLDAENALIAKFHPIVDAKRIEALNTDREEW